MGLSTDALYSLSKRTLAQFDPSARSSGFTTLSEERNLLRVLHVGRSEAGLFYSMELADTDGSGHESASVPMVAPTSVNLTVSIFVMAFVYG